LYILIFIFLNSKREDKRVLKVSFHFRGQNRLYVFKVWCLLIVFGSYDSNVHIRVLVKKLWR
jgi:hypothetical protein